MEPSPQPESQDISSKAILLLVALTLVVSFISAWVSIANAGLVTSPAAHASPVQDNPSSAGQVTFELVALNDDASSGVVALEITEKK